MIVNQNEDGTKEKSTVYLRKEKTKDRRLIWRDNDFLNSGKFNIVDFRRLTCIILSVNLS